MSLPNELLSQLISQRVASVGTAASASGEITLTLLLMPCSLLLVRRFQRAFPGLTIRQSLLSPSLYVSYHIH